MLAKPTCLHIPSLYEDSPARIVWEAVDGATGYRLECVFDEDFGSASEGFVIYDGEGVEIPGPDQGLTWEDLRTSGMTWDSIKEKGLTWREISFLPPKTARGLSWNSFIARQLTWNDIVERGLTWEEWKNQSDAKTHIVHTVSIPPEKNQACFRISAYSAAEESTYLTSGLIAIIPLFKHDDKIVIKATQGEQFYIKLICNKAIDFSKLTFVIGYDPKKLELVDFTSQTPEQDSKTGEISGKHIKIESNQSGKVQFKITRNIAAATEWTGLATAIFFKAVATGDTEIKLM